MLTIQPKISNYHQSQKNLYFRGDDNDNGRIFEEKVDFYENQIKEYDEAISDKHTPKQLKKIMKCFRIISEALLEGWAVAWGASKGSKLIKSSIVTTADSKTIQKAEGILKPIILGVKKSAKNIAAGIANTFTKIKDSKFMNSVTKFFKNTAEKMNKNSFGRGIVKSFETIGSGLKILGQKISNGWNKLMKACDSKNAGATYDKVTQNASKVLGVGAGAAGGYNAATKAEDRETKKTEQNNQQIIDKDYNDGLDAALDELEDLE